LVGQGLGALADAFGLGERRSGGHAATVGGRRPPCRGWTATSQSMRPAVRRAPTRRAPCADGPAGSSVQWAVADTACCQPGQVLLQAVPEVLPAGAVPPGDLAEGAQ